jgi:hypothetical protein
LVLLSWVIGFWLYFPNCAATADGVYRIGTYYFPGWKSNQKGNAYADPWATIKRFPEREPLLGWYEEDAPEVMNKQLKWMKDHGLRFVVFDWLWGRDNRPYLAHGVNAFLASPNRHGMEFAVLWANHTDYNFSQEQFENLFSYWARNYFFRDDYLKVDQKPVVFIFSAQVLNRNARKIGMSSAQLLALAERAAINVGLPGLTVVGGIGGNAGGGFDYSAYSGYGGFSSYNLHGPATFAYEPERHVSHSYLELDLAYRDHWSWMLKHSAGLFVVPMSSGWDKRAWGGSKDPKHDNSASTPRQFRGHLLAAREVISRNHTRTRGMGVICCWNEYGEGSIIEPTKQDGFSYLEQVRDVFMRAAQQ